MDNQWKRIAQPLKGDKAGDQLGTAVQLSSDKTTHLASSKNADGPNSEDSGVVNLWNLINFKPVLEASSHQIYTEQANELELSAQDRDQDNLSYFIVEQGTNGDVVIDGSNVIYKAKDNFLGEVSS